MQGRSVKIHAAKSHTVGARTNKCIMLQIDDAWHGPQNLAVPDGIRLCGRAARAILRSE